MTDIPDIPAHRYTLAPRGECAYCDNARDTGDTMCPPHTASSRCNSGKHDHCTCDTCY